MQVKNVAKDFMKTETKIILNKIWFLGCSEIFAGKKQLSVPSFLNLFPFCWQETTVWTFFCKPFPRGNQFFYQSFDSLNNPPINMTKGNKIKIIKKRKIKEKKIRKFLIFLSCNQNKSHEYVFTGIEKRKDKPM